MMAVLRLIRFPNLLIIAATQYLVRWCLMHPVLEASGVALQLSEPEFLLLVLSTMLIAAAGYAINDYFDTRIDRVNKPDRVVVGLTVNRKLAMALHIGMNLLAIVIGIYLAWRAGNHKLAFIHPMAAAALWFYSIDLKHRFLAGNLLIAALGFIVPFLPALYELGLLEQVFLNTNPDAMANLLFINYLAIGYGLFAFLINLAREIVKDMEDLEGDEQYGSKTLPIVLGTGVAKWVVAAVTGITILLLALILMKPQWETDDHISFFYFLVAVQVPLLYTIIRVLTAREKPHYGRASLFLKIAMVGGILSMPVFAFTF